MGVEEERFRAMRFQRPRRIPLSAGILPAAWMKHRRALDEIVARHPAIFGEHKAGTTDYDSVGGTYVEGSHTDAWGCVWSNKRTGMEAYVTGHPVPTHEAVRKLKAPERDTGFPHGFMYLRLLDLRGFEEAMLDFADEPPELQMLIDVVLEHNVRQARLTLDGMSGRGEKNRIVTFGDDLGMQRGLAIGAEKWRKYLKPCFTRIYEPFKKAGHHVYMHTDGWILDIIPDLAECGVVVLNPQVRANGLDGLSRMCRGKICVDLDLDRQLFPFCTPADIDRHVKEAVEKLATQEGGLWLKAEIGPDVPLDNVEAIFSSMERYGGYGG
jgi:hypothetical protein